MTLDLDPGASDRPSRMAIVGIDEVQLAMPLGGEIVAPAFLGSVLGLRGRLREPNLPLARSGSALG
jgi:hypothetical protein